MRRFWVLVAALAFMVAALIEPPLASAATCDDYATQKQAQQAADTRDNDGDGVYCETLPCPCSSASGGGGAGNVSGGGSTNPSGCTRPRRVVRIRFSRKEYPHIRRHFRAALRRGWPRILVVNRRGSDARRERLLRRYPTRDGFDRDEYPPAVGRGRGKGLTRGRRPRGWRADVRYVESGENRSHGSSLGGQLRAYCNGTRFKYVFR